MSSTSQKKTENNSTNASKKSITTLKKLDCKSLYKGELKEEYGSTIVFRSKCNVVLPVLVITILGLMFFSNNLFLVHSNVYEVKNVGKQINGFENLENVQLKLSILSRVINAIVLHNSFRGDVITKQKVMIEILDIQEAPLLATIGENGVSNVIHTIKTIDLLATRVFSTIDELAEKLNKITLKNNLSLSKTPNTNMLFFFNVSKFNFPGLAGNATELYAKWTLLFEELNLPKPDSEKAMNILESFSFNALRTWRGLPKSVMIEETKNFFEYIEEATSFISEIELYEKLSDEKYLQQLITSLDSVSATLTTFNTLVNAKHNKDITRNLDIIETFLSKTIKGFDKQELIAFPRGSIDMSLLLRDLDNEWLKKMLNNGNTLEELTSILDPIRILKTQIAAEKLWKKYSRNVFSMLIYQSRVKLENILAISNHLENLKNTLCKIKPLANLNTSSLYEFKTFLNRSYLFTNFRNELIELVNLQGTASSLSNEVLNIAYFHAPPLKAYPIQQIAFLREKLINNHYAPAVHLLSTKIEFFEKLRKQIVKLLAQTDNFKNVLTKENFTNIRQMFPHQFKLDIEAVQNHVKLLNFLSPFTNRELVAIEELRDMFSAARNITDKWRDLWRDDKTKIKATEGLYRLSYFPFGRETLFQLACSQKAVDLYQTRNLRQKLQHFVLNGWALGEKIESLPLSEKQFIDSDRLHFSSLNESVAILLSGVENLAIKFPTDYSLKSFGNTLSVLEHINVSTFDFPMMMRTLDKLKTMSIGKSKEVSDFEYILNQLEGLQFAAIRKKGSLTIFLSQTDNFFQSFFSKQSKLEWTRLLISVVIFAIALTSILFSIFFCIRTIKTGEPIYQDNANEL